MGHARKGLWNRQEQQMAKRQNVLEKLAQGIQKLNTKVEGISGSLPEILLINKIIFWFYDIRSEEI